MTSQSSQDEGYDWIQRTIVPFRGLGAGNTGLRMLRGIQKVSVVGQDLLALWFIVVVSLTFLAYPLISSILVATMIVLQASLGLQVLTRLLRVGAPSLVWLFGPGVIVGGALSFSIFQLTGRGLFGLGTACTVGGFATTLTVRDYRQLDNTEGRSISILSILGVASLGMSSQYEWLLPVAAVILFTVLISNKRTEMSSRIRLTVVCMMAAAVVLSLMLRSDSWWLISDDYKFFETLSTHLVGAGPTANWGSVSFFRYHWLSYGWSGLLDSAALDPGTLTTLTRVMPLTYSLSFAASLVAITQSLLRTNRFSAVNLLPSWACAALFQLDWSGTSTGASFAVLASAVAIFSALVKTPPPFWRRLNVYILIVVIVGLTKFPSVLTAICLIVCAESLCRGRKRSHTSRMLSTILIVGVAGGIVLAALPGLSSSIGGFSIQWGDQRGDELGRRGLPIALLTLAGREIWIATVIALGWILFNRLQESKRESDPALFLFCLTPLVLVGITMDAVVVGVANTNEYFSGPAHFVVGLNLLVLSRFVTKTEIRKPQFYVAIRWIPVAMVVAVFGTALVRVPIHDSGELTLIRDTMADPRLILSLVCLAILLLPRDSSSKRMRIPLLGLLAICILIGTLPIATHLASSGFRSEISQAAVANLLGPPDSETTGIWLKNNSKTSDLVATNYLRDREGEFTADYSLAMWSHREFLVLGPRLAFDSPAVSPSIAASEEFAASASADSAEFLRGQGVDYFVVDLDTTSLRSWEPYADVVAMTWRFWVLKIRP